MTHKHLNDLAQELGGAQLPDVAALTPAEAADLIAHLRQARRKQKERIGKAFDSALSHVPFLLRGAVRKLLGP